jgi:hypothetical protein
MDRFSLALAALLVACNGSSPPPPDFPDGTSLTTALDARFARLARFVLYRDGRTTAGGRFTLVMQRQANGWKILHDHTSNDAS